jgi:hypothetical protein
MRINPPRRVRVALYLVGVFVPPLAAYGYAKGVLGPAELGLIGTYVASINLLAAANTNPPEVIDQGIEEPII